MSGSAQSWIALSTYHARRALSNGVVLAFGGLATVLVLLAVLGLTQTGEGSWMLFGRDVPTATILLNIVFIAVGYVAYLFFPIGLSNQTGRLIDPPFSQYVLTRPLSRHQGVLTHLLGVAAAYALVLGSFLGLLWLTIWGKGQNLTALLWPGLVLIPVSISVHAFLVALVLALRSSGRGLVVVVLYFILGGFLTRGIPGESWWAEGANQVVSVLTWILPPVSQAQAVMLEKIPREASGTSPPEGKILLISVLSTVLFTAVSVWIYQRIEF